MLFFFVCFLMIRRPPSSTQSRSSAASDVYKRQDSVRAQRFRRRPVSQAGGTIGSRGQKNSRPEKTPGKDKPLLQETNVGIAGRRDMPQPTVGITLDAALFFNGSSLLHDKSKVDGRWWSRRLLHEMSNGPEVPDRRVGRWHPGQGRMRIVWVSSQVSSPHGRAGDGQKRTKDRILAART